MGAQAIAPCNKYPLAVNSLAVVSTVSRVPVRRYSRSLTKSLPISANSSVFQALRVAIFMVLCRMGPLVELHGHPFANLSSRFCSAQRATTGFLKVQIELLRGKHPALTIWLPDLIMRQERAGRMHIPKEQMDRHRKTAAKRMAAEA